MLKDLMNENIAVENWINRIQQEQKKSTSTLERLCKMTDQQI
jgi:hypothetical protein